MYLKLSAILLVFFSISSYAERSVSMPDLRTGSVHGGKVTWNSNTGEYAICVSADMSHSQYGAATVDDGVKGTYHIYSVDVSNPSNTDQKFKIVVLDQTRVVTNMSSGGPVTTPNIPGPFATVNGDQESVWYSVPKKGRFGAAIVFICKHDLPFCHIYIDSSGYPRKELAGAVGLDFGSCNNSPQWRACFAIDSILKVRFEVQEDKGALLTSITRIAHRCNGYKDLKDTHSDVQVNGGRAF